MKHDSPNDRGSEAPTGSETEISAPAPGSDDRHGLAELARRRRHALAMGGEAKIQRQHDLGRWTARERIERLLDAGSFQETGLLAHSDRPPVRSRTPADGKICGFGEIEARPVYVSADDVTVMAGAGGRVGSGKDHKQTLYAVEKGMPLVHLGDAGGARVPDIMGATGMMSMVYPISGPPRDRRVPFVATIMGECYGAPTWKAALADLVVQVKGTAMAVSGPPVLAAATGEQATADELGGWQLHAQTTGQVDLFAEDEQECLELVRRVLSYLPSNAEQLPPVVATEDAPNRRLDAALDIVPEDPRKAYDMHRLLELIVDAGSLLELKPYFDGSLITALGRLDGHSVGFLANNPRSSVGAMGPGACEKATAFICLCDAFHIPLVFLHDTPGFFVSKLAEQGKMPLRIMTFLDALHHSTVPRVSVIVRKSYGMAHCNMVGANMGADALLSWPIGEVSFMSPAVAVNVVHGRKLHEAADPEAARRQLISDMQHQNAPWEAAGLGLIDDVIDPRDTRLELIRALRRARGASGEGGRSRRLLASWPTMF
ncbi:MAG: carboxyl transferase domain-containing protein [Acidobacteriota bacterium]